MAVSKRLRYEILRRDNFQCRYCGAAAPEAKLNADHVIPQSLGGSDDPTNLVASCADCNAGKTSSMPDAMVVADVNQETFRRAAELKQAHADPSTAPAAHSRGPEAANALIANACTAWAAAVDSEPTPAEWLDFLLEVRQAMKEGYDRNEIIQAVEACGRSPHRTFVTSELPLHPGDGNPGEYDGVQNDEEFEVLADVGPVWLEAVRTGPPPYLAVSRLQASIVQAYRQGHSIERLKEAAHMGGLWHDPEISIYLGWLASQDAQSAEQREGGRA